MPILKIHQIKVTQKFQNLIYTILQDAHEFLGQVLDQLKEEVVDVNKSTPSPSRDPAEETTERDSVNPTTVNFEFEVMHTITCLQ